MRNLGRLAAGDLRLAAVTFVMAGWLAGRPPLLPGAEEGKGEAKARSADDRIEEIDQRQRVLERKWEIEKEAQEEKAKGAAVAGAGKDGFGLKSASGDFQLRIGGRFFVRDQTHAPNQFLLRRVRPIFEGTVFKYFDFRIMPDFGEGKAIVQDAYMDIRYWDKIRLRAGKFKEPVGLERLQSGSNLLFVERALPTNLVPNRDVGAQVYGDVTGIFGYAAGIFDGVADGGSAVAAPPGARRAAE